MANCRLAALHCGRLAGGRAAADWVARGNRIEFPSTERGKRQECGGLDSECMLCVCNRSITLILTMSLGNENTNSTCINGSAVQAQRNAAAALLLTLSATTDNQRIVGQKSLGKY